MSVPRRVGAVVPSSVSSAWLRLAAGLPMPVVLMSMGGLSASKLSGTYTAPHLLAGLNFLFLTLGSWFIAYLVGQSFLVRGQPGLLLLGCGMVVWGTGAVVATTVGRGQVNLQITIYNVCAGVSELCHLAGVMSLLRPVRGVVRAGLCLTGAYTLALMAVGLVVLVAQAGWLPVFFVQGQGGTVVRQLVMGSAVGMFGLTAVVLGNEAALTQWFSNLLSNAVKFAKAGSQPQIRVWAELEVSRWGRKRRKPGAETNGAPRRMEAGVVRVGGRITAWGYPRDSRRAFLACFNGPVPSAKAPASGWRSCARSCGEWEAK